MAERGPHCQWTWWLRLRGCALTRVFILRFPCEYGVELNSDGICPLQQVRLPFDKYKWQIIAKPGGYRHITFEEAAALNWSLLDRLKHPKELHSKVLQGVDSAAAAGAYKKGRSASRALNGLCRQACAIICCGDLEPFLAWVPTGENPADAPSSL